MLIKNTNGVILAEVLISVIILSIFYIGLFQFLDFQYKIWNSTNKNISYEDLFQEAKDIISFTEYEKLSNGNYYLFYSNPPFSIDGEYVIKKIQEDETIFDGMKIDNLGHKIDNTSFDENYFVRQIRIENLIYPFINSGINLKKICVTINNKDCNENCFERCFYITKDAKYYE